MAPFAEPISPELALVSPELAAAARAALPDRPWEAFLPTADVAALLRRPSALPDSSVAVADPISDADAVVLLSHTSSRRRPRVPVALILLAAFAGLLVAGSVLPARDAPTLGPPSATAGTTAPVPPPATPTRRSVIQTYTLTNGKGLLRVGRLHRSIVDLRVIVPCAGEVVVRDVPIALDGGFRAHRRVGLNARVPVSLQGRAIGAWVVRGTIRVTSGACRGAKLGFVARLG